MLGQARSGHHKSSKKQKNNRTSMNKLNKNSFRAVISILTTTIAAGAFCIETYISSGWSGLKSFSVTSAISDNNNGGDHLKGEINQYCRDKNERITEEAILAQPKVSVWLSPYRQFPEMPAEGNSRGKGDYEYFSYLTGSKCRNIASNYGAIKGSPADKEFQEASTRGLRSEFLLAKKLGYDLFALDTKKVWLTQSDRNLCKKNPKDCKETQDGFIVSELNSETSLSQEPSFLLNSARMGNGVTLAGAIKSLNNTKPKLPDWHPSESLKNIISPTNSWGMEFSAAEDIWWFWVKQEKNEIIPINPNRAENNMEKHFIEISPKYSSITFEILDKNKQSLGEFQVTKTLSLANIPTNASYIKVANAVNIKGLNTKQGLDAHPVSLSLSDNREAYFRLMRTL
ncbi:hypothetical protein N9C98_00040 [Synechococcus sp. AH-224-G16]|nr:hypothetical protein [Synechococcus sp. AH-224-G16]